MTPVVELCAYRRGNYNLYVTAQLRLEVTKKSGAARNYNNKAAQRAEKEAPEEFGHVVLCWDKESEDTVCLSKEGRWEGDDIVDRIHEPSENNFLPCQCGIALENFLRSVWFLLGSVGSIVGAEDEVNSVEEVLSVFLAHNCATLGQGKEVVHVDGDAPEELVRGTWGAHKMVKSVCSERDSG